MKSKNYFFILFFLTGITLGYCQETEHPFASDILRFKETDKLTPPPTNAILFLGSSSITMWTDVQDFFPGYTIINRGFGGSTLLDQIYYLEDIILPYSPTHIVMYCGENDLAYNDSVTAEMIIDRFSTWFSLVRAKLTDVKITYVSMKPSPSRWHLAEKFMESNKNIQDFLEKQNNANFVNIWDKMLDKKKQPDRSIFIEDMLHMNKKGYKIWKKAIQPSLSINNSSDEK
jgi:lysophospholipase L1-like esterase